MAKRKQRKTDAKGGAGTQKNKKRASAKPQAVKTAEVTEPVETAEVAQPAEAAEATTQPAAQAGAQTAARAEPITMPTSLPNAATLLDELQQRCESLRQWQRQANEDVQSKLSQILKREAELDEAGREMEHDRTHLDLDRDALKRAQLMFEKEKGQLEQTQQALEADRLQLERSHAELNDQKQELVDLRGEMDTEWASLARVRRAHESLAAALDADRTRVQELRLAGSPGEVRAVSEDVDADDAPGLSLTQAA